MSRTSQIQIGRMGKAVRGRLHCDSNTDRGANTFLQPHRHRRPLTLRILLAFTRIPPIVRGLDGRLRSRIAVDFRHNKT